MDRPPWFAFYPDVFASDINVEAMSTLQVGAYVLLLCKAWQADPPASLPNDDLILARLARVDAAVWTDMKSGVLVPFRLGTDGRLHSKRLRQEYDNALKRMRASREKAAGAANARWSKAADCSKHAPSMPGAVHEHCLSNAIQSESEKRNTEDPPKPPAGRKRERADAEACPLFAEFWAAYPNRKKRPDAAKAFAKHNPTRSLLDAILAGIERHRAGRKWLDGYIPHPATWLNAREWEDDPEPPRPQARPGYESQDAKHMRLFADAIRDDPDEEDAA